MHGGVALVEQSRFGQQEEARARRTKHRATRMYLLEPGHDSRIAAAIPATRPQPYRRHDDDIAGIDVVDRVLHTDRQDTGKLQEPGCLSDARARSEERRGGTERVRTCRYCWWSYSYKNNNKQ